MSLQATRWAYAQKVGSPTGKAILAVLAEACDEHGDTFIGHDTIAERTELTRRAVITHMAKLEDTGFIRRKRRSGPFGQRTSDGVSLCLSEQTQGERGAPRAKMNEVHLGETSNVNEVHSGNVNDVHLGDGPKVNVTTCLSERHDAPRCTTFTGTVYEPSSNQALVRSRGRTEPSADLETLRDAIWELTPSKSRSRSSRADLAKALEGALKRGGGPEAIRAGVIGYLESADATKEGGRFAKGVHRIVENDRWASFSPPIRSSPSEVDDGEVDGGEVWRSRVRGFSTSQFWNADDWGPRPGKAGCAAPIALLVEHGFAVAPIAEERIRAAG